MSFANLKVSTRLSAGFGSLFLLIVLLIGLALSRLGTLDDAQQQIVQDRWARADAAGAVAGAARNLAEQALGSLAGAGVDGVTGGTAPAAQADRKAAEDALAWLARAEFSEPEKAQAAQVRQAYAAFDASLGKVLQALPQADAREATVMVSVEVLMRPTTSVSVSSMVPSAASSLPNSPPRSVAKSWLRSPAATVSAM